jgi:OmpA-OmpF porin, OOP family
MIAARTLILAGVAAAFLPGILFAQDTSRDAKNQGYLVDSYGNAIVTSSNTGLCWRDSDWTPARSIEPCDPVARKAEAPAPKVAAAERAPVKPAAVAPPRAQSFVFSADALFAFDKAVIKPEGKVALDDFARQLGGAQYDVVFVTGHTDRFGSNEYNQKLSERRAQAVKDYLVSKEIADSRLTARGKGESEPVTEAGSCPGTASAKVIACLQPDRRVHVEVTGMKGTSTSSR